MSLKIGLQVNGSYYKDLSALEKTDLLMQLPDLEKDRHLHFYRFKKTPFDKWIILNAWATPINLNSITGRSHGS